MKSNNVKTEKEINKKSKYLDNKKCECGGGWMYITNKQRHLESKKHKKYLEDLEFQKNLKPELNENEI